MSYTAWDIQPFAQECGYSGAPFIWDEERRFQIRCELDAAYFHLYQLGRLEVVTILETFSGVRRKDEQIYGCYRTKELILENYDAMKQTKQSGRYYQTPLDPPPGDPQVAHSLN